MTASARLAAPLPRRLSSRSGAAGVWFAASVWAAHVAAAAAAGSGITRISLERNCFGCPAATVLELRRDGTATVTTTGTARSGTPSSVAHGRLGAGEFERLASLVESQGYFQLDDLYADPQLQDGPWSAMRVVRAGREKQVVRRDDAGPASLQAVEAAIDALQQRIVFSPERKP